MNDISPSVPRSEKLYQSIPFTRYDAGWVVLCIGMAIGSGIVFMPVQIGIKGIWVFIASVIIAYPVILTRHFRTAFVS